MNNRRTALTLLELIIVLAVLVVLATVLVPLFSATTDDAKIKATQASLRELQQIIMNRYMLDMAGVVTTANVGVSSGLPCPDSNSLSAGRTENPQLHFLFVNPQSLNGSTQTYDQTPSYNSISSRGWRGPYLLNTFGRYSTTSFGSAYGSDGDYTVLDGWGNPIVIAIVNYNGTQVWGIVSAGENGTLDFDLDNDADRGLPLLGVPTS